MAQDWPVAQNCLSTPRLFVLTLQNAMPVRRTASGRRVRCVARRDLVARRRRSRERGGGDEGVMSKLPHSSQTNPRAVNAPTPQSTRSARRWQKHTVIKGQTKQKRAPRKQSDVDQGSHPGATALLPAPRRRGAPANAPTRRAHRSSISTPPRCSTG